MRIISFPSSLGTINVSLDTIEAFLARSGSGLPDVSKLTVRLTPLEDRRTVKPDVRVSLYHGRNVREQCDRISHYIAESTKELLGLEDIGEVSVTVDEVAGGESSSGADRL
jgi:hypothetical protein